MPRGANFGAFTFSAKTFGFIEPTIRDDIMKAEVVTITTTPTLLSSTGTTTIPNATLIYVPVGGTTVYVGGEDITADDEPTGGFPVLGGGGMGWDLFDEGDFYAVVASGTQKVRVLRRNAE